MTKHIIYKRLIQSLVLVILAVGTTTQVSQAQEQTLITGLGRVRNLDQQKPLKGAIVNYTNLSTGESRGAVSNPSGYFRFKDVVVGQRYRVLIDFKGYFRGDYLVTFENNQPELIFNLQR